VARKFAHRAVVAVEEHENLAVFACHLHCLDF
jgi:hypothetical protein